MERFKAEMEESIDSTCRCWNVYPPENQHPSIFGGYVWICWFSEQKTLNSSSKPFAIDDEQLGTFNCYSALQCKLVAIGYRDDNLI